MTNSTTEDANNKIDGLNLIVIALSIYVLISLIIDTLFVVPLEISRVLSFVDNTICVFFLIEFFIRFYRAENKLKFMKWGWIDLISSIPNIDFLRAGRALRLIRLLRILRAFRSTKHLVSHVYKNKAKGLFSTIIMLSIALLIFSSISILQFETAPNSNIKTAEDAIWWAYVTITTVGYGDKFPVTTGGRILACVLMTTGIAIFGTFTAYVSSWFLVDKRANRFNP